MEMTCSDPPTIIIQELNGDDFFRVWWVLVRAMELGPLDLRFLDTEILFNRQYYNIYAV